MGRAKGGDYVMERPGCVFVDGLFKSTQPSSMGPAGGCLCMSCCESQLPPSQEAWLALLSAFL